MRQFRSNICAALVLVVLAPMTKPALASTDQVPIGPRAIGLGGAYTAIAEDVSAIFWNPAGLARIGHQELAATRTELFGTDLVDSYTAFLLPLSYGRAVAVDWYHSGFDDGELGFGENRVDLSYAHVFSRLFSAGLTVKYLDQSIELDASTVQDGRGMGLDAGILITPHPSLRLGVTARNAFDSRIDYGDGSASEVVYPQHLVLGAAYAPSNWLLLAGDVDDRLHLGVEVNPAQQFALRGGLHTDPSDEIGTTWTAGAGLEVGIFRFDYAYEMHPVLDPTHHLGVSLAFNFNPARIRIEAVEVDDLYASLYKSYAREPFGHARIRNLEDEPLEARIRVEIPGVTEHPSEDVVVLAPKSVNDVSLTAILDDSVVRVPEHRTVQVEIAATYQSVRVPRTDRSRTRSVIYGAGALSWDQGVGQAAAFVTPRDPIVERVAREAARLATDNEVRLPTRNLDFMAAIFAVLESMGLTYVPDPTNAYSQISKTPRAVDTVLYPRQTLAHRSGDCDDTSVLLSSILGNVGVATRFVDVPGHLFLLADSGLAARNSGGMLAPETQYVVDDGRVWIPLETTAIPRGFMSAWEEGAQNYASWSARGDIDVVDVTEAQARFEAPSGVSDDIPAIAVEPDSVCLRLCRDTKRWRDEQDTYLTAHFGAGPANDEAAANARAKALFLAGRVQDAREQLDAVPPEMVTSLTVCNRAAIAIALGDVEAADRGLRDALYLVPDDAGVWLNLGLLRAGLGDPIGADLALTRGLAYAGGLDEALELLGLPAKAESGREGSVRLTAERAMSLPEAGAPKGTRSTTTKPVAALPRSGPCPGRPCPWARRRARSRSRWSPG